MNFMKRGENVRLVQIKREGEQVQTIETEKSHSPLKYSMLKSKLMAIYNVKFLREVDKKDGNALYFLPIYDGPLSAIEILNELVNNKMFDDIFPIYSVDASNYQDMLLLDTSLSSSLDRGNGLDKKILHSFSAFYRNKNLKTIQDMVEATNKISKYHGNFNFNLQKFDLPLDTFESEVPRDYQLDIGFVDEIFNRKSEDTNLYGDFDFYADSDKEIVKRRVYEFLRKVEKYNSPLWFAEAVRSIIISIIDSTGIINYLDLIKKLDAAYEILDRETGVKTGRSANYYRNRVTAALNSQMKSYGIIDYRQSAGKYDDIVKGSNWEKYSKLNEGYIEFIKDVGWVANVERNNS